MNKKRGIIGIDDAIVVCVVVAVGALAVWFAGPSVSKTVSSLWGGNKNQAKQVYKYEENRTSYYQDDKGRFVPAPKQDWKRETRENVLSVEPPLTWFQKYGGYLVLIGITIIAFPSFGAWLTTKARSNLSQLVTGIEQAKIQLPKDSVTILENNLSKKMDTKVKAQVKKIKATIKADDLAKPAV